MKKSDDEEAKWTRKHGDHAANARLIAAAPEMYQALHEIYQCLIQQYVPETELPTLRALAKRALAKATKSPKEFLR